MDELGSKGTGDLDPNMLNADSSHARHPVDVKMTRGFRWPGILKPDRPSEAYALVLLVLVVVGALAYLVSALLPGATPWNQSVDRVCYATGNTLLAVRGDRAHKLEAEAAITVKELHAMEAIQASVPTEYVLRYNSLLHDRRETLELLKKELNLARAGKAPQHQTELEGVRQVYEMEGQELRLNVCGQGTTGA